MLPLLTHAAISPSLLCRITCWNFKICVLFSSNVGSRLSDCSCLSASLLEKAAKPQVFPSNAMVREVGCSLGGSCTITVP